MNDPYVVLGIPQTATDKEIKKAYRTLSKKYHPDSYMDSAKKEWAEDKFQEIQQAYNQIVDERSGKSTRGYGGQSYGSKSYGYGSGRSAGKDDQYYMAAANYIRAGKYNEALNVLNGVADHDGRWYYFCSVANLGVGNTAVAIDYAKRAVDLDPYNQEYMRYYQKLKQGTATPYGFGSNPFGGGYGGYGSYGGYGRYGGSGYRSSECSTGNVCLDLWCMDSMCECLGGNLCCCC